MSARWFADLFDGTDELTKATRDYAQAIAAKVTAQAMLGLAVARGEEAKAQLFQAAVNALGDGFYSSSGARMRALIDEINKVGHLQKVIEDSDTAIARLQELMEKGFPSASATAGDKGKADEYDKITTALQRQIYTLDRQAIQERETNAVARRELEVQLRLREQLLKLKDADRKVTEAERVYLEELIREQIAAEERLAAAQDARRGPDQGPARERRALAGGASPQRGDRPGGRGHNARPVPGHSPRQPHRGRCPPDGRGHAAAHRGAERLRQPGLRRLAGQRRHGRGGA